MQMKVKSQKKPVTVEGLFLQSESGQHMDKLPPNVVQAYCVNSFKKKLDDWSMDVEL
jgi:hypothetical protein